MFIIIIVSVNDCDSLDIVMVDTEEGAGDLKRLAVIWSSVKAWDFYFEHEI